MLAALTIIVATSFSVYFPSAHDTDEWGLRAHNFSVQGPHLIGEAVSRISFDVTLINFSKEAREHELLPVARATRQLSFRIIQPDGTPLSGDGRGLIREPFTQSHRLRAGEFHSVNFQLGEYIFARFDQIGRYRLEPLLKIDGKPICAPPVEFEVVAIPPGAVLISQPVERAGHGAKGSSQPAVQQVQVRGRTLLIYRGPYELTRLAELPGKCEMTVEGTHGEGRPLRITYADTSAPGSTCTLTVHSVGGRRWTQEDQDAYDYKHHIAPAPRPRP